MDINLLDIARAFNKVQHNLLQDKLALLRVAKQPIHWIENISTSRTQQVVYGNALSAATQVTSGVIQGSSLGFCLFFAFISDLHKKVKTCKLFLFADDSKMASSAKTMAYCLLTQADLDAIHIWSVENQLLLSLPTCICLHYGFNNSHTYIINGVMLLEANSCIDLGIRRSSDFSYAAHAFRLHESKQNV